MLITNNRCYAQSLGECNKISREHAISKNFLAILNETEILCSGLPWLKKGENIKLRPESLASNILCKNHNEKLSPLDDHIADVLKNLKYFIQYPSRKKPGSVI